MFYIIAIALALSAQNFATEQVDLITEKQSVKDMSVLQRQVSKRDAFVQSFLNIVRTNNFSNDVVQNTLRDLLNGGHIHLLRADYAPEERTLGDLLKKPDNEWIFLQLAVINSQRDSINAKKSDPVQLELCKKEILALTLENISRPTTSAGGYSQTFAKGLGKLNLTNPSEHFISNEGYPSIGDDDKHGVPCRFIPHSTNLGAIHGPGGNCVMMRSGRTNSKDRMLESVVHACLEQMNSQSPQGIVKAPDGSLEFTHVITSYINPLEDNKKSVFLSNMMQAVDEWPQDGFRMTVQSKKIILRQPIFQNQMFSTVLDSMKITDFDTVTSQDRSAHLSFNGNQRLLSLYIAQNNIIPSQQLLEASKNLDRLLVEKFDKKAETYLEANGLIDWGRVSIESIFSLQADFFNNDLMKQYQKEIANFLVKERGRGIMPKALFALLFRREMPATIDADFVMKPQHGYELHVADVDMYRNIVCTKLNLSQGKQCKHGLDRTGTGIAFAIAQDRFYHEKGQLFLPVTYQVTKGSKEHCDLIQFKRYFREALLYFAAPVGVESRGRSGVTSIKDDNPSVKKYLICKEDLGFGSPAVTMEEVEVDGLSYDDVAALGERQYKGILNEAYAYSIAGQHIKEIEASVQLAVNQITPEIHSDVENKVLTILKETGWNAEGTTAILNHALELDIPVTKLRLDERVGNMTRLQKLRLLLVTTNFNTMEHGKFVQYALFSIVHLLP